MFELRGYLQCLKEFENNLGQTGIEEDLDNAQVQFQAGVGALSRLDLSLSILKPKDGLFQSTILEQLGTSATQVTKFNKLKRSAASKCLK